MVRVGSRIQKGLLIFLAAVGASAAQQCPADDCAAVTLSADEREILTRIVKRDEYLRKLADAQKGLSALNTVLKIVTPGPVKLTFAWNQGAIEGWRTANKNLARIGQAVSCEDIVSAQALDKYEACFWDNLWKARGCEAL